MTLDARLTKIRKSMAIYSDPASSAEQKEAAKLAIARLQTNLPPEFWMQPAAVPESPAIPTTEPSPQKHQARARNARRERPISEGAMQERQSMLDEFVRAVGDAALDEVRRRMRLFLGKGRRR